ncbi:hypothetical protein [Pyxidicoccus xibeiensis]|uniref:hypothetical protein n=1 Tax=Pyxidicoccus xibeiensis TaxID=2906759 RepID=UPI0020A7E574|nr:hypothetical protein [Pyxidicoccus xibeiensis]MCP3143705.1 hypothetical protein [Pyxidicoccus xibeiensis]
MSSHHDEYTGADAGQDAEVEARDALEPQRSSAAFLPDDDPEEVAIACRTKSLLPAEPDIVASKIFTQLSFRTAVIDLRLGPKVTFNPGLTPQACAISADDAQLLPARYVNLLGATRVVQLPGRLLFQLDVQDTNRPGTLAFRLKFEEQRIQPKRAVILATVDLRLRTVMLARG